MIEAWKPIGRPRRRCSASSARRDTPVGATHVEHRHPSTHELEAQQHRDRLRDDGGERRAADAPAERADHEDHEHDVQAAGQREEHERRARVADRADDRREVVEEHHRAGAEEADLGEDDRVVHEFGGRLQQHEQRAGEQRCADREQHACTTPVRMVPAATERRTAAKSRAPNACAVGIAKPERQTPREPQQQEQHAARRADRGERVDAEVAPDDDGIDELVQLLDDVADEQGDGEHDDDAPRAARRQGGGHEGGSRRRRRRGGRMPQP